MTLVPLRRLVEALPLIMGVGCCWTLSIFITDEDLVMDCFWLASGLFSWLYLFSFSLWLFLLFSLITWMLLSAYLILFLISSLWFSIFYFLK